MQQVTASYPPLCSANPVEDLVAPLATRFLARQPILDVGGQVIAYELLFREGMVSSFSGPRDMASRRIIDDTMVYGLGKLTAGLPAFINCTAETLSNDFVQMLPAPLTVLEVLEDVEVTEEVVRACIDFQRQGYRIALDDFEYSRSLDPLIRIADYIKIDFRISPAHERRELMATLREFKGVYLAEKVETREEYDTAREEGFKLFQGYYFCKPSLLKKNAVPSNRVVHLRLLKLMHEAPLPIGEISELVKSEPALAYRLLRYVNSAGCGISREIGSLETALLVVGDDLFRRMATLAIAVDLNVGSSPEILRMALVRARFCELAATRCGLNPTEQYLLGLFSLLDAMLQASMEEAIAPLSLAPPIRDALLGKDDSYRCPIRWLESHEHGEFSRCDELAISYGMAPEVMELTFGAASLWADELLAER